MPPQRLAVDVRGVVPVAGDPDGAREALLLGADDGFEGAALRRAAVQVVQVADGVQLDQVDVVGLQPLQASG